jgi:hypothetical protein
MTGAKMSHPALPGCEVALSKLQVAEQRRRAAAAMSAAMMKGDVDAVLTALRPLSALTDATSGIGRRIDEQGVGSHGASPFGKGIRFALCARTG